ncbi:MAG: O-antigen ligase family protein [Candidatus Krumholzibacteriota bacterium]|nr:O-antigen ligase family protein [Candidatus Krumholzibacteriota bacterium]
MKKQNALIISALVFVTLILSLVLLKSALLAIAAIFALVMLITIFFHPYFGLLIYLIFLILRPMSFIPYLAPLRIMLNLALVIILFFLIRKIFNREEINIFATRQNILMFILFLIVPISDLSNFNPGRAWNSLNEFLTLLLLFVLLVLLTGRKYRMVFWCLCFSCLFLAINGLVQHFNGVDLFGTPPVGTRIKYVSIFGDPNDLALALVSSIPIILFHFFSRKVKLIFRIGLIIMLTVLFMAIFYTNSRGGYLAVIAVLVSFAIKNWGVKRGLIAGSVLVTIALLMSPSRMSQIEAYGGSESGRVFAWMHGLGIVKSRPAFGIGMNNFIATYDKAAHSAYIKCMAELGLIGFSVWAALIFTSFRDLVRIEKISNDKILILYSRITQVSLIGFLTSAFFLSQTYSPIIYILLAMSAILSLRLHAEAGIKFTFMTRKELLMILTLVGLTIVFYKILMILY